MLPPEGNTQNKPGNGSKCVDEIEYPKATYCVAGSAKQKVEKFTIIGQICHKILNPIFFKELLPYFDPGNNELIGCLIILILKSTKENSTHFYSSGRQVIFSLHRFNSNFIVRLLTIGLHKFGDDFPSIRSQILTPRTSKQLENRFNNLKCRRTAFNPVQDYYLRQIKPLTVEEEELLNAVSKLR
ncbi:hypothetical protein K502DRAFT_323262 [Neoconidiobolus thromboides FSU 785]|nr:hypothetical protein K502DRAFT_323262 [Neoconidiobolus thromboides FSU 785]